MDATPEKVYRPDIDGLRAIAVAVVVVFHFFPEQLPSGFIGVDIFFVLSGFLITGIIVADLEGGHWRLVRFYQRRIVRIFPALVVVLLALLVVGWWILLADEYAQLGWHTAAAATFVSNWVLWQESGYFDGAAETKPLLHLWSLGIEEQFYVVWPLLMAWAYRRRWPLASVLAALAVSSFATNLRDIGLQSPAAYYSPMGRAWELLVGAGVALLVRHHKADRSPSARVWAYLAGGGGHMLAWMGVVLLSMGLVMIDSTRAFPGIWALLPVMGTALLILAGPEAWFNQQVLAQRWLVRLGLVSYPLYLWHWPLLVVPRLVVGGLPETEVRLALMVLALLLAVATYRWVEGPIKRFTHEAQAQQPRPNGRPGTRHHAEWALLGALVMLGAWGGWLGWSNGAPERSAVMAYQRNTQELTRTPAQDSACQALWEGKPAPFHYCRMTDVKGSETILVLGDSHAHVAYPGIAEYFAQRGINTVAWANSGCPPFLGAEYGGDAQARAQCRQQIEAMLQAAVGRQDVRQIVLFARGTKYYTGLGFGEAEKAEAREPYVSAALYFAGLQATVDRLVTAGKTVAVVAENPELGFSPEACLPRPLRQSTARCTLQKQVVLARQADYLARLAKINHATIVPTVHAFCPNDTCQVSDKGQLLYADDDHLSVAGSRYQMAHALAPYIGRPL